MKWFRLICRVSATNNEWDVLLIWWHEKSAYSFWIFSRRRGRLRFICGDDALVPSNRMSSNMFRLWATQYYRRVSYQPSLLVYMCYMCNVYVCLFIVHCGCCSFQLSMSFCLLLFVVVFLWSLSVLVSDLRLFIVACKKKIKLYKSTTLSLFQLITSYWPHQHWMRSLTKYDW